MGVVIPFPRGTVAVRSDGAWHGLTASCVMSIQQDFAMIAGSVRSASLALESGLRDFSAGLGEARNSIERHSVFLREIQEATELASRDPEAAAVLLADLRARARP